MQTESFSRLTEDEVTLNNEEFQAGYEARVTGAAWASSATRSWRAGWSDADAWLQTMAVA
jgi:hypothetical protein